MRIKCFRLIITGIFVFSSFLYLNSASAGIIEDIADRQRQIQELQKQIEEYEKQIQQTKTQKVTLQNEINKLNAQIGQLQLQIKSLNLSINQTGLEISNTQSKISEAEESLDKHREALAQYIKIINATDQVSLPEILIKNESLSQFFNQLNDIQITQGELRSTIENIKSLKSDLQVKKSDLEEKQSDLINLHQMSEVEKRNLDQIKTRQNQILKQTQGQESKFQQLVQSSKLNLQRLQAEITFLQQNGVSVSDAVKYGQLAAIAVGIRPAFLLAELEIESGLGVNVGKCNRAGDPPERSYRAVMKPTRDIQPFIRITRELGLDTETTPVSCPQRGVVGWGGAMGPAQFLPSTWMGYKEAVAQTTGHNPANPWNIQDAFTAAALKLAKGGATAKTRTAEVAASKAYYSGRSTCSTAACNSYANAVQRKATEIEANL
ncbi:MAG: Peptidase M23 [Candidatus Yanofskybacteria bacterium GW2011_GWA1_44_21]|uniref:Transglycosylase SLT domain-containing protein n=2 Tax=Candidatus Yanofskyibacteriota TaxID=1752733 RepID=A0A1F8H1U9_9BACT|nr:MAG: Peptidase M23 [Candidatus Yanofskybacteria bacterium GW2011_GWA2_44_10]KKT50092.1 MAG: Peptidase M23 [Candidatus Yanofskybacteria bacterium GW2011_GWA1_44_21]KKT90084.1 MAG: Peptidase M23 [Candidatus Yanofskybacteria bacterium GW2011_GWB1_45_11]OGN02844.1 MAG: hypothetical protein A2657_02110 [Candidatus Yanofskybacteria bacterium RIFCSPHIGHO2_01_FULL_44_110b]OGN14095.1 MAG: hypothetical protein A3C01_00660 [Candidatus Yanofskybacteria bacterium RIFCSPHIGHO2_02_FULL_44_36b]OGN19334.1 M